MLLMLPFPQPILGLHVSQLGLEHIKVVATQPRRLNPTKPTYFSFKLRSPVAGLAGGTLFMVVTGCLA